MNERIIVRSVSVPSVVRMTFALSLSMGAIVLIGIVALYVLGLVSGGLGGVEGFIASLGFTGFRFSILPFIAVFMVLAALVSAILALVAAIVALLYNHLTPIVGGLVWHVRER